MCVSDHPARTAAIVPPPPAGLPDQWLVTLWQLPTIRSKPFPVTQRSLASLVPHSKGMQWPSASELHQNFSLIRDFHLIAWNSLKINRRTINKPLVIFFSLFFFLQTSSSPVPFCYRFNLHFQLVCLLTCQNSHLLPPLGIYLQI